MSVSRTARAKRGPTSHRLNPSRKTPPAHLTAKRKQSPAFTDGHAVGLWLAERASHVLLAEFYNRKIGINGVASQRVSKVMDELRAALGVMANDPKVAAALHQLDGSVWDCVVEHEDRAWHAAWALAMNLRGGR